MSLYYQDDFVTLYHGDCVGFDPKKDHHKEWLTADVLVTDPPYGVRWESKKGSQSKAKRASLVRNRGVVANDGDTSIRDAALDAWGDRPAIAFGSWKAARPAKVRSLLVWNKDGGYSGPLNAAFFTNHEDIYVMGEGWRKSSPPLRSVITTTENRSQAPGLFGHPTPKPVGLMEKLIDRCPEGIISDPFAGSGSTLVAAKSLGRKSIGVELDESYCEVIAKRCAQGVLDIFGEAS